MRLALWQGAGIPGDIAATVAEVARAAEAARGADLLVFPEGFLTGYHLPGLTPGALPGVEGALAEIGGIARRARLTIAVGTHLEEDGALRNSAVILSPEGERGRYHKRALFGQWEKATFRPGASSLRFPCAGMTVSVAICYDVEFPELTRAEALAGSDLVVVPTALMAPYDRVATRLVPARALENQFFVAYCNRTGAEAGLSYVGLSRICGPSGETLASAGAEPALLVAEINPAACAAARADASYLEDLRHLRIEAPAAD